MGRRFGQFTVLNGVLSTVVEIALWAMFTDALPEIFLRDARFAAAIVMGRDVRVSTVAVAQGNLTVTISETPQVSQPAPFSRGQTVVAEQASIQIKQEPGILIQVPNAPLLSDVVRALNALGATPQDLLAILQAIKASGALHAELEVI
jgi:flagellar P-ring protein precursor FlgI